MDRIKNIILKLKLFLFRGYITKPNCDVDIPCFFDTNDIVKEVKKEVRYATSPLKFLLKENFKEQFNRILADFNEMDIIPKIGLESEFYALNVKDKNQFFKKIYDFSKDNCMALNKIKDESCKNQFELEFLPYLDLSKLIDDFNEIKKFLLASDYQVNFRAKPFYYDVGSSLQINISLNDKNGDNLFRKQDNNQESMIMLHSIAGLLNKTNEFLDLYISSKDCKTRYDLDFNRLHQISGKITSPTYNCWGINNRTCSIRIPTPKCFSSYDVYLKDMQENRRIEYRVPSSDCDIGMALYGVLCSVLYGIKNKLFPSESTSNNVILDDLSSLKYEIIE